LPSDNNSNLSFSERRKHRSHESDAYATVIGAKGDVVQTKREKKIRCENVNLAMSRHARIATARSTVHGWGAFALENIKRGHLIYEYCGEVVSQSEADRRGKIYDKVESSFLFNLNKEVVVDAARKGNKMKFANHSSNPNCFARVVMSLGNHRVGIYAKRDIEKGEELFFNYSYSEDHQKRHFEHSGDGFQPTLAKTSGEKKSREIVARV
jgi:SET domain-containing protein